jgi:hypothetical protein
MMFLALFLLMYRQGQLIMIGSIESMLFAPNSKPYGIKLLEWTIRWWRWLLSGPREKNPAADKSGEYSVLKQDDPNVRFLASTFRGSVLRNCTIPFGKAIFMPIINYECSFADEPSITTANELELKYRCEIDDIKHLSVTIDESILNNLANYRIRSPVFSIDLQENNILGVDPGHTHMISDGFWIFLKPLEIGGHKVTSLGSCRSGKIRIETTYDLHIA